jgi:hypothetical protein
MNEIKIKKRTKKLKPSNLIFKALDMDHENELQHKRQT